MGPAGLISMEDGEAVELIQRAIVRDGKDCAFLGFGPVARRSGPGRYQGETQCGRSGAITRGLWRDCLARCLQCDRSTGVSLRPTVGR